MDKILVINSGSTSLKYELFGLPKLISEKEGYIENIGSTGPQDHGRALKRALDDIGDIREVKAIGHRVVHGGDKFVETTKITPQVLKILERYSTLAPLHNPPNILGIKASLKLLPNLSNFACFDTAFHKTIDKRTKIYPLPYKFYQRYGIRRYGFHGLSHQYLSEEAAKRLKKPLSKLKLITCHLGGGSSICAVKFGKSVDTSMGFTPAEGVMMVTRSGDIDPAIPLYLIRRLKLSPREVDEIVNFQSGLLGISGVSKDVLKIIYRANRGNKRAKLSLEMFYYRIKKYIGAYYAILGGLDGLVFSAGMGRNPMIRKKITSNLPFLKRVKVMYIPTDEEKMIAREVAKRIPGVHAES